MEAVWQSLEWPGIEHVRWDGRHADSAAVMVLPDSGPLRVAYRIDVGSDGGTERVEINGKAIHPPGDVDIAITPFTNTLPIRRLRLAVGESAEIDATYVAAPDFEVSTMRQRYTRVDEHRYRYESPGFEALLTLDEHDLVTEYPGLWRRIR
jgi:hypothetical protein